MVSEDKEDSSVDIIDKEHGFIQRLEDELVLTGRYSVVRAHVVEEIFDSVLPLLGIILAGIIAEQVHESFLVFEATLLAALGTSIAHFISGFGGTYLAESAEGKKLIDELEKSKGSKLSRSVIISIEHETTLFLSFVKGFVPAIGVLFVISPMFLALFGWIDYITSLLFAIGIGLSLLFVVGIFLGRIAKTNIWISALKTLFAGFLTMGILFLLAMLTGL